MDDGDYAMCGDPTCRNVGCLRSTVDAYMDHQQAEARRIVRSLLGLDDPSESA